MKINRRDFLKTTAATSLYFAGFGLPSYASQKKKNLVIIMLQGGMDGLCAVPIKNDKNFEKLRSKINLDRTLKLTSDFDLHPALENFKSVGIKIQPQCFMLPVFRIKKDLTLKVKI